MRTMIKAVTLLCVLLLCNGIMAQQKKAQSTQKVDPTTWTVIEKDGKTGFIDKTGKIVIQPTFDYASCFTKEGLAEAKKDGKWGLIDKTGKWKVKPTFQWLSHCDNNYWWAKKDGKMGFIDKTGKWTEKQESRSYTVYDDNSKFHDGLARVKNNDLWGFVDKTGKIVIEPQFTYAEKCFQGACVVEVGGDGRLGTGKYGIIDKTGKWIVEAQYPHINFFTEDLASVVSDGKLGFMDKTGKWVIEPRFDVHNRNKKYGQWDGANARFEEGLACVLSNGKFGYIDKTGKWVIEPQFDEFGNFKDGYATAKKNGKWGVIDKKGNWVIQPTYCGAQNYKTAKNQFVVYNCSGNTITGQGVIDATGKIIIPLEYLSVWYEDPLYKCSDYNNSNIVYFIDSEGKTVYQITK